MFPRTFVLKQADISVCVHIPPMTDRMPERKLRTLVDVQ